MPGVVDSMCQPCTFENSGTCWLTGSLVIFTGLAKKAFSPGATTGHRTIMAISNTG